jgi:hypothetical protein
MKVLRPEELFGLPFFWELIDSHVAYHIETYGKPLPTLFDSTAATSEYHYFQVIAHTSDPLVFYISAPDSGYSVDNMAPSQPQGLEGEQTTEPEGMKISWDPNTESDLSHYAIYRGSEMDFEPDPGNLMAAQNDIALSIPNGVGIADTTAK